MNRIKTATIGVLALVFIIFPLFSAIGESKTDVITLKLNHPWPPEHDRFINQTKWWGDRAEKLSNGKLKIEYYPMSQLGKMREGTRVLKGGLADITVLVSGLTKGILLWDAASFPFAWQGDPYKMVKGSWEIDKIIGAKYGFKVLIQTPSCAPYGLFNVGEKPIKNLKDMKGVKVRGLGGLLGKCLTLAGATSITVTTAEVYTALQRGIVSVSYTYAATAWASYRDLIKSITNTPGMYSSTGLLAISLKTWNKLPKDVQQAMLQASREVDKHYLPIAVKTDQELLDKFKKQGVKMYEIPPEDMARWKELILPNWDKWGEKHGDIGRQIVQVIKKYSR